MPGKGGKRSTSWAAGQNPVMQKGAKHKRTILKESIGLKNWEGFKSYVENEGAEKLIKEMKKLTGRNFVTAYQSMTEFVKPKLARQEVKAEINETLTLKAAPAIKLPDGTMLQI